MKKLKIQFDLVQYEDSHMPQDHDSVYCNTVLDCQEMANNGPLLDLAIAAELLTKCNSSFADEVRTEVDNELSRLVDDYLRDITCRTMECTDLTWTLADD